MEYTSRRLYVQLPCGDEAPDESPRIVVELAPKCDAHKSQRADVEKLVQPCDAHRSQREPAELSAEAREAAAEVIEHVEKLVRPCDAHLSTRQVELDRSAEDGPVFVAASDLPRLQLQLEAQLADVIGLRKAVEKHRSDAR
jgi:S-methylmethionine-dependent homocysteine/selenocysteine methylase